MPSVSRETCKYLIKKSCNRRLTAWRHNIFPTWSRGYVFIVSNVILNKIWVVIWRHGRSTTVQRTLYILIPQTSCVYVWGSDARKYRGDPYELPELIHKDWWHDYFIFDCTGICIHYMAALVYCMIRLSKSAFGNKTLVIIHLTLTYY